MEKNKDIKAKQKIIMWFAIILTAINFLIFVGVVVYIYFLLKAK